MVTDDTMDMKQLLESEIHYRNEDYMEADNDQCADWEVGDNAKFYGVEYFAEIKHSEYKTNIDGVEETDVQ